MWTIHQSWQTSKRGTAVTGVALAFLTVSTAVIGATLGSGTANADCVTASSHSVVDCDGIQHGQLSGSTVGAVDGHGGQVDTHGMEDYTSWTQSDGSGSYVGGQAVEDSDGTQGEFCGAPWRIAIYTVPRC